MPAVQHHEAAAPKQQELASLGEAQRYFLEIALGSEFGQAQPLLHRWERPVRLCIVGEKPVDLVSEAHLVVEELKQLIPNLNARWVDRPEDSNLLIYFGPYRQYSAKYAPKSLWRLRRNLGYFQVQWYTNRLGIKSANLYVDTHRAGGDDLRKHLLREELTQVFGLMVDSERYSDSIFYQKGSRTTEYSPLDKLLIQMLYDSKIHSGMDEQAIRAAWRQQKLAPLSPADGP